MSLFLGTANLTGHYQLDCSDLNISDAIERECLSVLHKLHDQVNGLQLVQVVVQPLAKLFNPANLAALAATNVSQSPSSKHSGHIGSSSPLQQHQQPQQQQQQQRQPQNRGASVLSTPPVVVGGSQQQHHNTPDSDGLSISSASYANHSRSQSFASSFGTTGPNNSGNVQASPNLSTTSTYMMSPDTAQALIARLDTDRDVNWLMEIIGYGLSMPFSLTGEQDSVKDCCTIYCEWLAAALLPYNESNEDSKYQQLSKLVPVPIRNEPNRYARKMLSHLYNVFLPRQALSPVVTSRGSSQKDESDAILTAVSRQAVLCHRVLRTIEGIAHNRTNLMDRETWNHLLALLLTVNDKLLSPPTEPDDIGTQLHDRILGVLFDLMLLASSRSIPDAALWKTFHELCLNWRHRPALVEHWKRITSLLTKRIVMLPAMLHKGTSDRSNSESINVQSGLEQATAAAAATSAPMPAIPPKTLVNFNPIESSVSNMSYETLSQTWYRFLNVIGNPVELADPSVISRTDEFYHAACVANNVLDPRQHPCLNVLPQIFLNSMVGLREFIESFVGTYQQVSVFTRRSSQAEQQQQQVCQFKLNPDRPKCNSILHIFGDWLFSAALIGSDLNQQLESIDSTAEADSSNISGSITSVASSATATSSHTSTSFGKSRQSRQLDSSAFASDKITLEPQLTAESFESGQAEAMSSLCKIFSSKSSSEDVSPSYLARFYLCIQHCLNFGSGHDLGRNNSPGGIKRQLLASVLMNSPALLQRDLDGINLLIPSFIKAIEFVFECNDKEQSIQPPPRQHSRANSVKYSNVSSSSSEAQNITSYDLRRACILTLVNLLAYPLHFRDLAIRNCLDGTSPTTTFASLRPRLLKLLFIAMQTETDPNNMQILFGGLSLAVHDLTSNSNNSSQVSSFKREEDRKARVDSISSDYCDSNQNSSDPAKEPDSTSQSSFVFNSSDGFLIKSLHVTCHLLINIWKQDNSVSLAALKVLTTIARISTVIESKQALHISAKLTNNNVIEMKNEYMQTTRWICDYICNQCSRPPPAHSRDMHSTIVAAYQCLSVWFYNHPYLLNDNNCMNTVMEVIELGVSGQKSRSMSINPAVGVATPTTISKGEKLMKPSSLRVREAAESLLNICMVRTDHFNGSKRMAACDTSLSELDIAEMLGAAQSRTNLRQVQDSESRQIEAYKLFRYFSDEDSVLFALIDGLNHDSMGKDSLICLLRTPFGKHCWKIKFNYYSEKSRDKIIANKSLGLLKRPFQHCQPQLSPSFQNGHNKTLYFNKNAKYFPDTIEESNSSDLDKLVATLDDYAQPHCNSGSKVTMNDSKLKSDLDKMNKLLSHQVVAEQKVISECTIRVKRHDCEEPQPGDDLETARLIVTHLGLKNGLTSLTSVGGTQICTDFVNDLRALDDQSTRTCDRVKIFYVRRNRTAPLEIVESVRERHNVSLDFFECLLELGHKDMCQELEFLVPMRLDDEKFTRQANIIVCWLECCEDMSNVPCEQLLAVDGDLQDHAIYFVCPMKNGLFKLNVNVSLGRQWFALPLIDGMTVSKSMLAGMVTDSILNLCRRRRLDADSYQLPHVKRRLKMQELCNNHRAESNLFNCYIRLGPLLE